VSADAHNFPRRLRGGERRDEKAESEGEEKSDGAAHHIMVAS
jgi:hypothetical protein